MNNFETRVCPLCRSSEREMVFNVEVDEFCRINWSYNRNYRSILAIEELTSFPIDRCLRCGFIYARLLPSAEFLSKLYDRVISTEIAEKASWNLQDLARRLAYIGKLCRLMSDNQDQAILDFGCGFGATTRLLAGCGMKVVAYDPSSVRIETVKQRCAEALVTNDVRDVEKNAPFSGVILDNVLEHVPEPHVLLELISGLLRSSAIVYVSVPSYEDKDVRRLQRDIQQKRLSEMTLNPWEHLSYFDIKHLDQIMGAYKLVPLRQCELPGSIDIGLRSERVPFRRIKNSIASGYRLFRHAFGETAVGGVNDRIYRLH